MKLNIVQIISFSFPFLLPVSGSGAELGTRQRTIRPVALATNTTVIYPSAVSNYAVYGYSSWQWGSGEDEGRQFTNMPAGYPNFLLWICGHVHKNDVIPQPSPYQSLFGAGCQRCDFLPCSRVMRDQMEN